MKTKSFSAYLETRLSQEEIAAIEEQADLELKMLQSIQKMIANTMNEYIKDHNIGFNELVRRLRWSPTKVSQIQRGEANLTLASMAHLFALLGKEPNEIFKL